MSEQDDFDRCYRSCRTKQKHTLVYGSCAHAPMPEPTVSLSKIFKAEDGYPAIGYDTYTEAQLARLIEPALMKHGRNFGLFGLECEGLAYAAAHAIMHRNEEQPL